MKRLFILFMALLFVSSAAFAEPAEAGKTLTVRTFQFKHKQAEKGLAVVKPLVSAEGSISIQGNSLIVTDSPANLRKIAAELAKFDKPAQELRLTIRLVAAGRAAAGKTGRVPDELREIAPKLALLRYDDLESLGSADVTGHEGDPGSVDLEGYRADFKFGEYDAASDSVKLGDFKLSRLEGDQLSPLLKTSLNLKLGQTVIVGATKQADSPRALMIVVSAKR